MKIAPRACAALSVVVLGFGAAASATVVPKPTIVSFAAAPKSVPGGGGNVKLTVHVRNATTCVFGGVAQSTKRCSGGSATVTTAIAANSTASMIKGTLWVYAVGKGGKSSKKTITYTEAAALTSCTGTCKFTFPKPDDDDIAAVGLNGISQDVAWPDSDPYSGGVPAGDQLDDVNVTICAGSTGISDASFATTDFSLSLPGGQQAQEDLIGYQVATGLDSYGAVGPNQCTTGDMYYDVPSGDAWSSLNFSYDAFGNQLVYVWNS